MSFFLFSRLTQVSKTHLKVGKQAHDAFMHTKCQCCKNSENIKIAIISREVIFKYKWRHLKCITEYFS